MARFANVFGIDAITFTQNIQCMCPLGGAFCTYQVVVKMEPGETIPDYCEVENAMRKMSGTTATIEECVAAVYDIMAEYEPNNLSVSVYCDDAVHFPVTVIKSM